MRVDLLAKLSSHSVTNATGKTCVPCIAHGDFVLVESLQADHVDAKSTIMQRQQNLVNKLNEDEAFAKFLLSQPGMSKFFVYIDNPTFGPTGYYGTLFFYEFFFNDIDNIWLICDACNLHKSNAEALAWFEKQWLYGQGFLEYIADATNNNNTALIQKVKKKQGLAEVAIEWFWSNRANYISVAKNFYENVKIHIDILNQELVILRNSAGETQRYLRKLASLEAKINYLTKINTATIAMPRADNESVCSGSNEGDYIKVTDPNTGERVDVTEEQYRAATAKHAEELSKTLPIRLAEFLYAESTNITTNTNVNNDTLASAVGTTDNVGEKNLSPTFSHSL